MGYGRQGTDGRDLAVFHFRDGIDFTVAEVHAHARVKSAGQGGGNGDDFSVHDDASIR